MKEEIETKHFERTFAVMGTNRAAEPRLTKNRSRMCAEVLCVSPKKKSIFFFTPSYPEVRFSLFYSILFF